MSQATVEAYRADFARRASAPGRAEPTWLTGLREQAIERFVDLGFPTARDEEWRRTNVAPIAERAFAAPDLAPVEADVSAAVVTPSNAIPLVFVDGQLDPEHSELVDLPGGTRVVGLADALASRAEELSGLGTLADDKTHAFRALNTALFTDGLLLDLPAGSHLERPVHALFVSSGREVLASPRLWIRLGEGARAALVEQHVSRSDGTYWTNAVTEVALGPGSHLDHVKVQSESAAAFHTASLVSRQEGESYLGLWSVALGARLSRFDVFASLDAEEAQCVLGGLYLGGASRIVDHHTWIDHAAPSTRSREAFRGILDGRARGVFRGRVHVRPDAQQIDAEQSNRCLMLSDDATLHAQPQLEIYADDVKCSHGNAVGRLDESALFYLRSRGIPEAQGRAMLTVAFALALIEELPLPDLREDLARIVESRVG